MTNTWSPFQKPNPNRPAHHTNNSGTSFSNPWPSASAPTWTEILQSSFPLSFYPNLAKKHPDIRDVKVVTPDWGEADLKARGLDAPEVRDECIIGTTLGHAGVMIQIPLEGTLRSGEVEDEGEGNGGKENLWVVFDPIFSARAGPTQYTGPGRTKRPPCQVEDFPGCDAIVISHNHYDHLDLPTIQAILKKFPKVKYFVPLGNKSWLANLGVPKDLIIELDWWEEQELSLQDFGYKYADSNYDSSSEARSQETNLRFSCVPAQHNSARSPLDQGNTLWCGWVVEQLIISKDAESEPDSTSTSEAKITKETKPQIQRKGAIYHAGDTGYRRTAKSSATCPAFHDIGSKYGPFDLSFLPIWRGGSLSFFSTLGLRLSHEDIPSALHASPADAIDIHVDVKSKTSVGVHFGTFVGSENESLEAILEFEEAREERGVGELKVGGRAGETRAGVVDIGGSVAVRISGD